MNNIFELFQSLGDHPGTLGPAGMQLVLAALEGQRPGIPGPGPESHFIQPGSASRPSTGGPAGAETGLSLVFQGLAPFGGQNDRSA